MRARYGPPRAEEEWQKPLKSIDEILPNFPHLKPRAVCTRAQNGKLPSLKICKQWWFPMAEFSLLTCVLPQTDLTSEKLTGYRKIHPPPSYILIDYEDGCSGKLAQKTARFAGKKWFAPMIPDRGRGFSSSEWQPVQAQKERWRSDGYSIQNDPNGRRFVARHCSICVGGHFRNLIRRANQRRSGT